MKRIIRQYPIGVAVAAALGLCLLAAGALIKKGGVSR